MGAVRKKAVVYFDLINSLFCKKYRIFVMYVNKFVICSLQALYKSGMQKDKK